MDKKRTIMSYGLFLAVLSSVVNLLPHIYNTPTNSTLLTVSFVGSAIILFSSFIYSSNPLKIKAIDVLMVIIGCIYLIKVFPFFTLWNMGCITLIFLYLVLRTLKRTNYILIYISILISVIILSILSYLQYLGTLISYNRNFQITGPYHNPAILAGVLGCLWAILICILMTKNRNLYPKWLFSSTLLTMIVSLPLFFLCNSRSLWIGITISTIYAFYSLYKKSIKIKYKFKTLILTGVIITILSIGYGLYRLKPDSADGRILIWKVTLEMIKDKPIKGFGLNGFESNYMHYQAAYLKEYGSEREKYLAGNNHLAYNELLRLWVDYGLFGIIIFSFLIYEVLKIRKRTLICISTKTLLLFTLIWGMSAYPANIFPILFLNTLALSCVTNSNPKSIKKIKHFHSSSRIIKLFSFIIGITFIFYFTQTTITHKKFYSLLNNRYQYKPEEYIHKLSLFENSLKGEPDYWLFYCTTLNKYHKESTLSDKIPKWERIFPYSGVYLLKGDFLQRIGKFNEAQEAYWLAHYMVPSKQRARGKLAFLYKNIGKEIEALELAQELLTEKVKIYGFDTYDLHQELEKTFYK